MKRLLRSKKGFKIPVTIVAILFLALVIILFTILFKGVDNKKVIDAKVGFASIGTDVVLNSFLQSPAFEKTFSAKDLTPGIGNQVTNADLISWTCGKEIDDRNFKVLEYSANTYFKKYYPPTKWSSKNHDDWLLALYYYSDNKQFPIRGVTQIGTFRNKVEYFDFKKDYERKEGATQVIPCAQKDVFVKVALFTK